MLAAYRTASSCYNTNGWCQPVHPSVPPRGKLRSLTRWTRWIVILAGWRRDANSTRNEQGEGRERKIERDSDIQCEPQACCRTAAAPTNSLSNSNGQTKPVATLPGWDYYTRDLNNKYVRVSCATETCVAFKRVHECYFNSIRRAMPMLP